MSDQALLALDLAAARDGLAHKAFSARELAAAYNDVVADTKALNAYITPTPERALAMADAADKRIAGGEARPLDGIPIAVKDLFCTKGILTTAGSRTLDGFHPPYESTVTERLWQAGAVMLGKTNLDEFAMGSSNTTSWYGPVENPWRKPGDNRPLVPGGSSGGSAAAVGHRVLAHRQARRRSTRHRCHPGRVDLVQLLDPVEDVRKLVRQRLELVFGDPDPRQGGDMRHGGPVQRHQAAISESGRTGTN